MMKKGNESENKSVLERIADFFRGIINAIKSLLGLGEKKVAESQEGRVEFELQAFDTQNSSHAAQKVSRPVILARSITDAQKKLSGDKANSFKWRVYAVLKLYAEMNGVDVKNKSLSEHYQDLNAPSQNKGAINLLCNDRGLNRTAIPSEAKIARGRIATVLDVSSDQITDDFLESIGNSSPEVAQQALKDVVSDVASLGLR